MSDTAQSDEVATDEGGGTFEIASYERLIKLLQDSPDNFMLRTSEATRRALVIYEQQKARHRESER
jgi:hypothetical protein